MDLREFRVVVRIVDRVAKRALFAEKQRVALEGQCAEWRRIADELKAETVTAESVIKELRTECDDLRRVFSLVHGSLGIQQGEHIGNAIDALKKERDELATRLRQSIARGDFAEMRLATLTAEMETERERHKTTPAQRSHPVEAGEYVKNDCGEVCQVREVHAEYLLTNGWSWDFEHCTPCDPPQEASHITPEGKQTAEGAVMPKPGDVVRLVREPTHTDIPAMLPWSSAFGMPGDTATVVIMAVPDKLPNGTIPVRTSKGQAFFWPLSCVEIVKGGKS